MSVDIQKPVPTGVYVARATRIVNEQICYTIVEGDYAGRELFAPNPLKTIAVRNIIRIEVEEVK